MPPPGPSAHMEVKIKEYLSEVSAQVKKNIPKPTNQREVVQDMAEKKAENVVFQNVEQEVVAAVSCCRVLIFPVRGSSLSSNHMLVDSILRMMSGWPASVSFRLGGIALGASSFSPTLY
jgi:hypothetical protein